MRRFQNRQLTPNQRKRASLAWQELLYTGAKGSEQIESMRADTPPAPQPRARRASGTSGIPLERQVLKAVLQFLRHHPKVASVERTQSGLFMQDTRTIRVGFVGKLDISGFLKGGRAFEVEVKRPGGQLTAAQSARIAKLTAAGALTGCVTSVEEMEALLA